MKNPLGLLPKHLLQMVWVFFHFIAILSLFRLGFFLYFYAEMGQLPLDQILRSFLIGFRFDARLTALIMLPYLLLTAVPLFRSIKFWKGYWVMCFSCILILYSADLAFYAYLNTRLDATIIGLAKNTAISLNMLWESYPLIWGSVFLVSLIYIFRKSIYKLYYTVPDQKLSARRTVIFQLLSIFIILSIAYGKFSRYPFRWSDAFYSTNQSANQLAINPVLYFLNTYTRVDESFNLEKVREFYPVMAEFLGVNNSDKEALNFSRQFSPNKENNLQPNIVIIILETFPAFKCGLLGNPVKATPHFDTIARESIFFSQFYVPKMSTAATIFSTLTGLPDMAIINKSSTRDPFAIEQDMFINQLEDYAKHFFIGGSANWGDLNGFLKNNIEDIVIHEEGSYTMPETNAWGISDYHLLQEMHETLSMVEPPFTAIALTAGHHRPYTIPQDIHGFDYESYLPEFQNYGFGEDDYYAFTFMDFAVGEYIKAAKTADYFENTLFVIYGDHGSHGSHLNLTHGDLSLHPYHVPLAMYGPGLGIQPKRHSSIMSEIDLFPTLLSLLNISHHNASLGRDILDQEMSISTAFMFSASSQNYALLTSSKYIINSSTNQFQLFDPLDISAEPVQILPDYQTPYLLSLAEGYYETARYLRYLNSRVNLHHRN
ncbi:MAG: sulfatase-like hydrolase/transferase [Candidatus Marinimicrobia bacterium]|nr:sulfatase-like hydrolase/transferase [Candidatus Neomarinimicrobiota bacterium]